MCGRDGFGDDPGHGSLERIHCLDRTGLDGFLVLAVLSETPVQIVAQPLDPALFPMPHMQALVSCWQMFLHDCHGREYFNTCASQITASQTRRWVFTVEDFFRQGFENVQDNGLVVERCGPERNQLLVHVQPLGAPAALGDLCPELCDLVPQVHSVIFRDVPRKLHDTASQRVLSVFCKVFPVVLDGVLEHGEAIVAKLRGLRLVAGKCVAVRVGFWVSLGLLEVFCCVAARVVARGGRVDGLQGFEDLREVGRRAAVEVLLVVVVGMTAAVGLRGLGRPSVHAV